jgi:RNA polymerase sigma factor (sigma-70 family)
MNHALHASSVVDHAPPGFLGWVAALVHSHRATLLRAARGHGLTPEEALDAVQDAFATFLTLPEARSLAHEGEDAVRFLSTLLRHHALNRRRKHRRHQRGHALLLDDGAAHESSEALLARAEDVARVNGCILQMAQLQRAVVQLSLIDEVPHQEVSELLELSPGYVRVLLHRARAHVRTCVPKP